MYDLIRKIQLIQVMFNHFEVSLINFSLYFLLDIKKNELLFYIVTNKAFSDS